MMALITVKENPAKVYYALCALHQKEFPPVSVDSVDGCGFCYNSDPWKLANLVVVMHARKVNQLIISGDDDSIMMFQLLLANELNSTEA